LNPITARALLDELDVKAGDWIAVNAATSSVAQIVRGLARRRKASVVSVVRSGSELEAARWRFDHKDDDTAVPRGVPFALRSRVLPEDL
jgi:NADPH:quinone reductase-like Zn-dependent oxidoreductase